MKKFLTLISVFLTAAVLLSGCENGTADIQTENETTAVSAAEGTEIQAETTSSETETTTETTTEVPAETSETTAETGGTTAEGLVISPSGYVLDPQNVIPEGASFWTETGREKIQNGLAYLIMELSDGETRIYGACPNEEPTKIIIEHNGIGDEFEQVWWTRYGDILPDAPSKSGFTLLDIDGDGENEVVLKRYAVGGTLCCIYALSVYKIEDAHYIQYSLDEEKFADDYIKTDIDNAAKTITVSAEGSDKDFVYDSSESCPEGVKTVWYTNLVSYDIEGGSVKMSYYGLIEPDPENNGSVMPIDDMIRVDFKVNLKDGDFVLSDPVITATDNFDSYKD